MIMTWYQGPGMKWYCPGSSFFQLVWGRIVPLTWQRKTCCPCCSGSSLLCLSLLGLLTRVEVEVCVGMCMRMRMCVCMILRWDASHLQSHHGICRKGQSFCCLQLGCSYWARMGVTMGARWPYRWRAMRPSRSCRYTCNINKHSWKTAMTLSQRHMVGPRFNGMAIKAMHFK